MLGSLAHFEDINTKVIVCSENGVRSLNLPEHILKKLQAEHCQVAVAVTVTVAMPPTPALALAPTPMQKLTPSSVEPTLGSLAHFEDTNTRVTVCSEKGTRSLNLPEHILKKLQAEHCQVAVAVAMPTPALALAPTPMQKLTPSPVEPTPFPIEPPLSPGISPLPLSTQEPTLLPEISLSTQEPMSSPVEPTPFPIELTPSPDEPTSIEKASLEYHHQAVEISQANQEIEITLQEQDQIPTELIALATALPASESFQAEQLPTLSPELKNTSPSWDYWPTILAVATPIALSLALLARKMITSKGPETTEGTKDKLDDSPIPPPFFPPPTLDHGSLATAGLGGRSQDSILENELRALEPISIEDDRIFNVESLVPKGYVRKMAGGAEAHQRDLSRGEHASTVRDEYSNFLGDVLHGTHTDDAPNS